MTIFKKPNYLVRRFPLHDINTPTVRVFNLNYSYGNVTALEGITFEVKVSERLAIVGPNGAGKSTLCKIIAGVLKPTEGFVQIYGFEPSGHICIAYVPQRNNVDWSFPVSVADVVMMGRVSKLGPLRWPSAHDWDVVHQALELVQMDKQAKFQINELSGGQQQRIFIARALAQEAELILMDEPFTGLDLTTQEDIFQILDELRLKKVTLMVAIHDLKLASERFDRVMLLNRRLLGVGSPQDVFAAEKLAEAYGSHLRLLHDQKGLLVIEDTCCDEGDHPHV